MEFKTQRFASMTNVIIVISLFLGGMLTGAALVASVPHIT